MKPIKKKLKDKSGSKKRLKNWSVVSMRKN